MGTVFNRGTKDKPNWYVGYRENGRWVYVASQQPTKAQAKRWVGEIEARVARGHVGIDNDDDAPQFKALFTSFLDALTNRNAADDRDVRGGEAPEVTDERRRRAIKTGIATNKRPALPPTLHPPPVIALWLPDPPSLLQSLPTFESRFVMRTASNTSWRLFALGSPVLSPR